jgi:alpha-galactosidase
MLEVGVVGNLFNNPSLSTSWLDPTQSKSHFCFWAMLSAPLILGADIRQMQPWVKEVITKKAIIAVNQDSLGLQAQKMGETKSGLTVEGLCVSTSCTLTQVWVKELFGKSYAILLFNRGSAIEANVNFWGPENVTLSWSNHLGLPANQAFDVHDLWADMKLGTFRESFSQILPPNDVMMLRLDPVSNNK